CFASAHRSPASRPLHSFPTRRSSDLRAGMQAGARPMPGPAAGEPSPSWLVAGLLLAVAIPFAQLGRAAFVNLDDGLYVTANPYVDRKSTRLNSSHVKISYAVFCLKKK